MNIKIERTSIRILYEYVDSPNSSICIFVHRQIRDGVTFVRELKFQTSIGRELIVDLSFELQARCRMYVHACEYERMNGKM